MSRQTLLGLSGWVLCGVVLLSGACGSGDLRAKRLVIEDENGNESIRMMSGAGGPAVYLVDPKTRKVRMSLMIHPELSIPSVTLYGEDGKESWDVSAWSDGPVVTAAEPCGPR